MGSAVGFLGIPLEDAVRMASETRPTYWVSPKRKDRVGADADLVTCSTEGMVVETIVAGEVVYHGRGESHGG